MPTFRVTPPTPPSDPSDIDDFLTANNLPPQDGTALHSDGSVSVTTASDPSAILAQFTNAPTQTQQHQQQALAAIKAYVKTLRAITPASNRTTQQNYELGMAYLLLGVFDGS